MKIEVSNGEIADKYTILGIKLKHAKEGSEKYLNILKEYKILNKAVKKLQIDLNLIQELIIINQQLWNIEDEIRKCESIKKFDEQFVKLARSVYETNDKRFEIKNKINLLSNSTVKEEKILPKY